MDMCHEAVVTSQSVRCRQCDLAFSSCEEMFAHTTEHHKDLQLLHVTKNLMSVMSGEAGSRNRERVRCARSGGCNRNANRDADPKRSKALKEPKGAPGRL